MTFSRKMQGAISVFLVIILVPMMTASALFVDAGKLRLGKSVAESGGDLALNTALTRYDKQLKDIYGLFATAQDMSDVFALLEDYYITSITSSGVDADTAKTYTEQLMAQLGMVSESGDIDDFLNIEVTSFDAHKKEGAALDNAVVLKKQIVDFMKYRSPINTGLSFLNSLQSFTTLAKQTELVEDRQKYYEAENEVMKNLYEAWKKICEYENNDILKKDVGNGKGYFEDMKTKLEEDYTKDYHGWDTSGGTIPDGIHQTVIFDIYGTAEYMNYSAGMGWNSYEYSLAEGKEKTKDTYSLVYEGSAFPTFSSYINTYKSRLPSDTELGSWLSGYYYSRQKGFSAYYYDLESQMNQVRALESQNNLDDKSDYILRFLVEIMRSQRLTGFTNGVVKMYTPYQQLLAAYTWADEIDEATEGNTDDAPAVQGQTILSMNVTYTNESGATVTEPFAQAFNKVNSLGDFKLASGIINFYKGDYEKYRPETNPERVKGDIKRVSDGAGKFAQDLEDAVDALTVASEKLGAVQTSLESGDLKQRKDEWQAAAQDNEIKSTTMAKQDLAEIDQLGKYFNADSVKDFKVRIDNIKEQLSLTLAEVKKFTYQNVFIGDIKNYATLEKLLDSAIGKSAVYNAGSKIGDLKSVSGRCWKWENGNIQYDWIKQPGSYLWLHGDANQLNLYTYMYQKFGKEEAQNGDSDKQKAQEPDEDNGEGLYETIKSRGSSAASEDANKDGGGAGSKANNIGSVGNLPSKTSDRGAGFDGTSVETGNDAPGKVKSGLSSMFSELGKALKNFGEALRDKLFIADYALSMFSYDTIELELAEHPPKDLKAGDEPVPQTLTKEDITPANNYGYGAEVEYIIFGGSDNKGNITKAYGSIYGIRLAMNLIYAFSDSEVREGAFAIATPISAATLGIIPVPLIQAAIIIAMACCESGIDLSEIKAGKDVALFKNKKTWHMSVSGMVNYAKTTAAEEAKKLIVKEGIALIDEGQKELTKILDMADDEFAELTDEAKKKVKENVVATFDTTVGRYANIAIQKMTSIATKAVDEAVFYITGYDPSNPEQFRGQMIEQVNQNLDSWLANEGAQSGLARTVQTKAVSILKEKFVGRVVDKIIETKTRATDQVEQVQTELKGLLDEIRTEIDRSLNKVGDEVDKAREGLRQKAQDGLDQGAQQLKDNLTSGMNDLFGSSGGGGAGTDMVEDNSTMASLLCFSYKDYLRLFLMIAMITSGGEQSVVLRIADCVQVNMCKRASGDSLDSSKFLMSKAAAYVEIKATVMVKPTMLALPIFADVEGNPATNSAWYTFDYHGIKGY